ncbi:MAG: hypothetical protein ACYC7A_21845 [Thermoanaerobaculia bacterium]
MNRTLTVIVLLAAAVLMACGLESNGPTDIERKAAERRAKEAEEKKTTALASLSNTKIDIPDATIVEMCETLRVFRIEVKPTMPEQIVKRCEKARDRENKRANVEREAANLIARELYGKKLRQHYLDSRLNIKVKVTGKNKDKITLTYALFDEVWMNEFKKSGAVQEMIVLGFEEIHLTDGYDYHQYFDFRDDKK